MSQESVFTHPPLPYLVVLRTAISDDTPPQRFEQRVTAYSVYEAVMQAIWAVGGVATEAQRYTIEAVGPDLAAWTTMGVKELAARPKGTPA